MSTAIKKNDLIYGTDISAIKARVKAELLRRNKNGDISLYGGSQYDYSTSTSTGNHANIEHINKIITPLSAINILSTSIKNAGDSINAADLISLEANLVAYEADTGVNESSCRNSCSGLCYNVCTTACGELCSGTCTSTCSGTCSGLCTGSCTYDCADNCLYTCETCSNRGDPCLDSCTGSCGYGQCGSHCNYGCDDTCTGGPKILI